MARPTPPSAARPLIVLCLAFALAGTPAAVADRLTVDNAAGDTDLLTGELMRLGDGTVWFQPSWSAEPIEILWDAVVALETDGPAVVVLDDGTRLEGRLVAASAPRVLVVESPGLDTTVDLPTARVATLNPPEMPAVRLAGSASAGLSITDGNTETQSLYAEGELVARTAENRYTLGLQARQAETDGETTAENARASFEYDHFLSERWYFAATALGSRDEFQDVKLRTAFSLSSGYQVLDTDRTALAVELGASYVNVDYFDGRSAVSATDESYPAGRWSFDLRHELAPERVTVFHQQEGFQSLDDGDDLFIRSKTGLRFSLFGGFIATTQVNLDYDGDPSPGRESTDTSYLVNLGVEW